ncbi:hypothetical protein [Paenibacillus anseongense]|uniref:hypothetical protein n=1 Tax=Paenibacillus anseongense TaxID=2682845 RepID=UPI002DBD86F1|nr:hypothetical protein [Paenibacillus anseongense]MEC0268121.1 hypothetical protein [Paenibacillus anseongense]
MNPFPEDYELIALFESEPIVLDNEIPWYYNYLLFKLIRDGIILGLSMEPACNRINIRMSNERQGTLIEIGYESIRGIEIYKDSFTEGLLILLDDDDPNVTLRLETKPNIRLISTGDMNFRM